MRGSDGQSYEHTIQYIGEAMMFGSDSTLSFVHLPDVGWGFLDLRMYLFHGSIGMGSYTNILFLLLYVTSRLPRIAPELPREDELTSVQATNRYICETHSMKPYKDDRTEHRSSPCQMMLVIANIAPSTLVCDLLSISQTASPPCIHSLLNDLGPCSTHHHHPPHR